MRSSSGKVIRCDPPLADSRILLGPLRIRRSTGKHRESALDGRCLLRYSMVNAEKKDLTM